jgi:hypothetical protein
MYKSMLTSTLLHLIGSESSCDLGSETYKLNFKNYIYNYDKYMLNLRRSNFEPSRSISDILGLLSFRTPKKEGQGSNTHIRPAPPPNSCSFDSIPTFKGPRPLAERRFRAVQSRRCRHNALRVFKWMCVHYSRVVPAKFIIVSSPLLEQAKVLHWTVMAKDLFPLHTDPHAHSCVESWRCKT